MKNIAIKLEVTNSRNDDKRIEWFFCDTDYEKNKWIEKHKKEQEEWNYNTVGAVSTRYYYFSEYLISSLLEMNISELEGMQLKDLVQIIKNCL